MADYIGAALQVAQLGASLLAQKKQQEEARKRATGDLGQKQGRSLEDTQLAIDRAYQDLDRRQPQDARQLAQSIGFQRAAALGNGPGLSYRRQAAALLGNQQIQRGELDVKAQRLMEDQARGGERWEADLNRDLSRYSDDHATDYIDPFLKTLGSLKLTSGGDAPDMSNLRAPDPAAFDLGSGVKDPGYTYTPPAASGGDMSNFVLDTPSTLQAPDDYALDPRKYRFR